VRRPELHDDVEFEARCFLCGVPFTEEVVNGDRCLVCGGTIVGVARKELIRNGYGYIASFLQHQQPFLCDKQKRGLVKFFLFGLIFGSVYGSLPEEPTERTFVDVFLRLLQDPTEDRQRALASLARDWLAWARAGVPPL
jgi:hypothetical protein